ncbi:lateral flagellar hook-associated protein LfgL [Aeromonas jandaei]|uniref:Lateral flagellar hook-associated protein LfgL n=1 Tax=Aeromonas jandaei TaxID=650 RepID=A0ABX6ZHQ9_AERJA|nr:MULTISPECIES: lateral flagellar hook-associated protein LfgL [Aeromonas]KIQ76937.1 flagellar hook-associated protein [Aeromonas sp. L_1B5_3]MBL0546299.1 lateral flagellar hook-associated protein LfgL [Aeromonas jandaei]MBL0599216.1 lateral flagellar hook-associated protein LfgL [Aeromonas jandaei]MBL0627159.1 lateral flagellar hook-associated protein LfgL [Aeromonas jandaei]MBL0667764.1 lateral flagellar hook-associated protein LfgL [Aeromonas jandaei]
MRISTNQIQLSMLDNLQYGFGEYARLDRQISSNKRILQPSDDPVGSVQLLGLKKEQVAMEQYQKNIANAKSQLSQGEIQLESMTNMLMRLRELTQTAATGSLSEDDRRAIATEVGVIKEGLFDLANARNESGSSLFAGSQVNQTTLVKNASGDYVYQGDALVREVSIAKGVTVGLNQTADKLFIDNGDFFKQLDTMVAAIESGAPDAADQARSMLDRSKVLQDDISQMVSTIGARMNLLDQVDEGHTEKGTYSKEVSNQIESLDYASAVTQQAHVLMALQVQQQAFAKVNGLSLFNYMP